MLANRLGGRYPSSGCWLQADTTSCSRLASGSSGKLPSDFVELANS